MPRLVRWYYSDVCVTFYFSMKSFTHPFYSVNAFFHSSMITTKKDPARARGTQQLASLTGGVMRPEGYFPTRGGPGRNPSTFFLPLHGSCRRLTPSFFILEGDEQSKATRIHHASHSIHPSLNVSIFAAHCSITHRIGTGLSASGS